ncbi:hypothetical protein GC163_24690 [bacterium]|nr:hypothetical protein [bacterium]
MQDHIQTESCQPSTSSCNQTCVQAGSNASRSMVVGDTATYARFSSDNQNATSNADQERVMSQRARSEGLVIIPECQFRDEAVSGTKRERQGLNQLLAAAEQGRIRVVLFYKLSRLAREPVLSMTILKKLVNKYRVRVISCTDGIDSRRGGWQILAGILGALNEQYLCDLKDHVLRGQSGTVERNFSVGDLRFGYSSVPSPGGETIGRGTNQTARRVYQIHEQQAEWVRTIFEWFVSDQKAIAWIVRELNIRKVPKCNRARNPKWNRNYVIGILRSSKYIGLWPWGETQTERDPDTGKISHVRRDPEESAQWERVREDLRIIDDVTYATAQHRLDVQSQRSRAFRKDDGRLRGSDGSHPRVHMLSGVFQCQACRSNLACGGANGTYLVCQGYRGGYCSNANQLRRSLAEDRILSLFSDRILQNSAWTDSIYQDTLRHYREQHRSQPDEMELIRQQINEKRAMINRLVDTLETIDDPDPAIHQRLRVHRDDLRGLESRFQRLAASTTAATSEPTREWVVMQLRELHTILQSRSPQANKAIRALLGGPIELHPAQRPGRKRSFWRGTITFKGIALQSAIRQTLPDIGNQPGLPESEQSALTESIQVDFVEPTAMDTQFERTWALLQQGVRLSQIAQRLKVSPSRMTPIMRAVAEKYGQGASASELVKRYRPPSKTQARRDQQGQATGGFNQEIPVE